MPTKERIETTSYFATQQMISHSSSFGRKIKGIYRSEYEELFARCLKNMGIDFEFERHEFKLINENDISIHYIPDFYIKGTSLFIEISEYSNKLRKHKILMFSEQYPLLSLMLMSFQDVRKYAQGRLDIDFEIFKLKL